MESGCVYALSNPRKAAFIFDPRVGLDIPLVVEFKRKAIFVEYPGVDDLEADFEVFPDLVHLREAAIGHRTDIDHVVKVGREYSEKFANQLRDDSLTLAQLTRMIADAESAKTPPTSKHRTFVGFIGNRDIKEVRRTRLAKSTSDLLGSH